MKPYRSMMYVPGNRAAWMEKAANYGADCLILDLEDSVPDQEKVAARPLVKAAIAALKESCARNLMRSLCRRLRLWPT